MDQARQIITNALAGSRQPAVLFSGGKDSSLLLHLVREQRSNVQCVWFKSELRDTSYVRQTIRDLDLDVWSWPPMDAYYIPTDDSVRLVQDFSFGPQRFPVVLDVRAGQQCGLRLSNQRLPAFYPQWDCYFIGYKDSDIDETLGSGWLPRDGYQLGRGQMYAPLRGMSDDDVWQAIRELGVNYDRQRYDHDGNDPAELSLCTACIVSHDSEVYCPDVQHSIAVQPWDRQASLTAFINRFHQEAA